MPTYALVIIETPTSREAIRVNRLAHRAALNRWISDRAADGALVGGEAFETEAIAPVTIRRSAGGITVEREPHHNGPESLGGYILIRAADIDAATEIATTWPESGETIEIRPIWIAPAVHGKNPGP